MKLIKIILLALLLNLSLGSCKKYLDLKPDQSYYIPSSLTDCQALLDNYSKMNASYPNDGEVATDHYYLTDATWSTLTSNEDKENYIWSAQARHITDSWSFPYAVIFNSNLVLGVLNKITPASGNEYNAIKGSALFFRGFALYNVASLFCKPYDASSSNQDLGVPVRLSPDIDKIYGRGTVQQTYNQIIEDLENAVELLPLTSMIKSRPNKVAAYAALARVYLSMRDYVKAGIYADLCLQKYDILMSYYTRSTTASSLFQKFNPEVIFSSIMVASPARTPANAKVVKTLYDSYASDDIRKLVFFRANTGVNAGTFSFKGSYDGTANPFNGLATDEMYLIRAECYARAGKKTESLKDLNDLLKTRWQVNRDITGKVIMNGNEPSWKYVDYTANNADEALEIILKEREKELIFRGIKWTDLRRLNKEPKFAATLIRIVNGVTYSLPPNDLRYTLLIPQDVINTTSIQQNPR